MATKHRGKAAQAAWAAKQGEKIQRARANYNPDAATREAERDHEYVLEQAAARRTLGRPTLTGETLKVVQVRLTTDQIATARRLGNGNASAGVRAALELAGTLHEQTRYARSKGIGICQGCRCKVDLGVGFCQSCSDAEIIFDLDYHQFGIYDPLESMRLQSELLHLRNALDCGDVRLAAIAGITFGKTLAYTCRCFLDEKPDSRAPDGHQRKRTP